MIDPLRFGALVAAAALLGSCASECPPGEAGPAAVGPAVAGIDTAGGAEQIDPLSGNAACYVCHIPFVRETVSATHFKAKIACMDCHGLSAGHANDEHIGATPPDVVFKREQVVAFCRKCHERHDVPPEKVVARFVERKRTGSDAVCTDCHGTHRIAEAGGELGS